MVPIVDADEGGLIFAARFDGEGGAAILDWETLGDGQDRGQGLWVHLDRSGPRGRKWIEESGLDEFVLEALLAEGTRPRAVEHDDGMLAIFRGVNLNPDADPEDMISIRMWMGPKLLISVRRRPVMAIRDLRDQLHRGRGPTTVEKLFVAIADTMVDRMGPTVSNLEDSVAEDEDLMLEGTLKGIRERLGVKRRQAIMLARHIAPQRDVLTRVAVTPGPPLNATEKLALREIADQLTRYLEDLNSARERAAVMQEELLALASEETNRRMYILSIVTAIFLPLGLFTGLLGINVGGMPGADNPHGFLFSVILLGVLAAAGMVLLKRARLF